MDAATLAMACSPEEHCLHRLDDLSAAARSHSPFLTGRIWASAQAVSGRPHSHVGMVASRLAQNHSERARDEPQGHLSHVAVWSPDTACQERGDWATAMMRPSKPGSSTSWQ